MTADRSIYLIQAAGKAIREIDPDAYRAIRNHAAQMSEVFQQLHRVTNETPAMYAAIHSLVDRSRTGIDKVNGAEIRKLREQIARGVHANQALERLSKGLLALYREFYTTYPEDPIAPKLRELIQILTDDLHRGQEELARWQIADAALAEMQETYQSVRSLKKEIHRPETSPPPPPQIMSGHRCACGKTGYTTDDEGVWWCKKDAHARGLLERPKPTDEGDDDGDW